MPYISIKSYPKDEEAKKRVADGIVRVFLENKICAEEAITLSWEEVSPDEWEEKIVGKEIEPNRDKMLIFAGKKTD